MYPPRVPRLWNQTIEAHRREVREAILDATATLVGEHGLRQVTMSQIAEHSGIGRATLYKYFTDVEAILVAWHEQHVTAHLAHLAAVRDQAETPGERLQAVLMACAHIAYEIARQQHAADLTALLHRDEHVAHVQQQLHDLIRDVLAEAMADGHIRDDYSPDELASYCRNALNTARSLPSEAAVGRLVKLTLSALRPEQGG